MYKSLNEFKIRPDATTGFHGNRKGYNRENVVSTLAPSFLAHLSRRLKGAYSILVKPASVCLCVCLKTFSNLNLSATSGPIVAKFYLNLHWGGGKAALGFGPDRIGTLVSMSTDSSHRVIMEENVAAL